MEVPMTEQRKTVGAGVTYIPQQIIVRDRIQMFVEGNCGFTNFCRQSELNEAPSIEGTN
jgi:hypothetical protein